MKEDAPKDIRCGCGKLIARQMASGYEIKCSRCKEHHVLPCPGHSAEGRTGSEQAPEVGG